MGIDTGAESTHDLLIQSIIDALIAVNPEGKITAWNKAATNLFERSLDDTVLKPLLDTLPSLRDDPDFLIALQRAWEGHQSFLRMSKSHAHRRHAEMHIIPLLRNNEIAGVMLLSHDISHRIIIERQLRELNEELQNRLRQLHSTNSQLAQLAYIAGHNIRGPIREIYLTVEGLLSKEARIMSHSGRASFRRIQASLNRMNLLLDDIITLAQINIADRPTSVVDVQKLIKELVTQFEHKLRESNAIVSLGPMCDIRAHRNQLLLLLQQLFSIITKFVDSQVVRIYTSCEKIHYTPENGDPYKAGDYHLLSIEHNSSAFDKTAAHTKPDISDDTDIHNYTGPAIAMIIGTKIMDVHAGFINMEKTASGEGKISCFFPIGATDTIEGASDGLPPGRFAT